MPVYIPKIIPGAEFNDKGLPQKITTAEKKIRDILIKADGNGDGYLSKDELTEVFKELGSKAPAWRACRCLRKGGKKHDQLLLSEEEIDFLVDYALPKFKLHK